MHRFYFSIPLPWTFIKFFSTFFSFCPSFPLHSSSPFFTPPLLLSATLSCSLLGSPVLCYSSLLGSPALCYTILYYTMLCCALLCSAILLSPGLRCAALSLAMLYCAMLCYDLVRSRVWRVNIIGILSLKIWLWKGSTLWSILPGVWGTSFLWLGIIFLLGMWVPSSLLLPIISLYYSCNVNILDRAQKSKVKSQKSFHSVRNWCVQNSTKVYLLVSITLINNSIRSKRRIDHNIFVIYYYFSF